MKVKHLKNQMKCFTLQSGQSLYLYPYAEAELSEQDFFLTKKLQAYVKSENALMVVTEDLPSGKEVSPVYFEETRKTKKQKKSLAKEIKE